MARVQAWYQYGAFCMRVKEHTRAEAAFREALSISQENGPAAAALACLGLALSQGKDVEGGPDPAALEWAEVLGHSLKDAAGAAAAASNGASAAGVLPWALLALLYRVQGEASSHAHRTLEEPGGHGGSAVVYCRPNAPDITMFDANWPTENDSHTC
jgi:tetratricopeptide (TPR) repeat protein